MLNVSNQILSNIMCQIQQMDCLTRHGMLINATTLKTNEQT